MRSIVILFQKSICLLLLTLISLSCQKENIETGVSKSLADYRKASVDDLSYQLYFDIPENIGEHIPASAKILFTYSGDNDLQLDFKEETENLLDIKVNGEYIPIKHVNEHLILPKSELKAENEIEINFIAGNLSLNRNEEYLYTLFVPARARTVFPLFDQPNLKAKYLLRLDIPESWEAVSNGALSKETKIAGKRQLIFKETKPISSYLFAFSAGKFNKLTNDAGDMTMYYRESDAEKVSRNAPEIFKLHRSAIDWLEDYTGISYPFGKFDFALIPTFQYGGMEHPGSIFYRESSLMLGESPSINQELSRASLIAHETAHMWFGDLVTMDWFDDVWLKEVFANFYAAKIVNPSFPEVNHSLRFLLSHYPRAMAIDRSKGAHSIQQNLPNLADAGSLYGAIIYQKAPVVMRNLETTVNKDQFQEGIREYLNEFSFGNATWDDLISIMSSRTENNLEQWNIDWVKTGGMPSYKIKYINSEIHIERKDRNHQHKWSQSLAIKDNVESKSLILGSENLSEKMNPEVRVNFDGKFYGYLQIEEPLLTDQLLDLSLYDDTQRAASWMMHWEALLNGEIEYKKLFENLSYGIAVEENPLILNYQASILGQIFWQYFKEDERSTEHMNLEELLFTKMMKTPDYSIKRTLYNSYRNICMSDEGIANLKSILNEELNGFSLPLSENDKISLAFGIALRDQEAGDLVLDQFYTELKNEDNKKRFDFIRPSISHDIAKRDSVFQSLLLAENREQEPWVGSSLSYLHHPLRRNESIKYLKQSLEEIEEIKQTGDIFFPARWLSAIFSSHNSVEAQEVVESFMEENLELTKDLRNKIYQATDMLSRVAERKRGLIKG